MARYILYGGKGGVGKTTCAAATGLKLAREGAETLVVSTDPAHSLADSYEVDLGGEPREVRDHLHAVEVDPDAGVDTYRELLTALADEFREAGLRVDEEDVARVFAAGVAPGSDEVATLDSFLEYVDSERWEYIVFDTAPTGHTLRLLDLPGVMSATLETAISVRGKVRRLADSARQVMLGPAYYALGQKKRGEDDVAALKERMERVRAILTDPDLTAFRVVLVPETMAVRETERLVERLREFRVPVTTLVVNKVLEDVDEDCDRCRARQASQEEHIDEVRGLFPDLDVQELAETSPEVHGLDALEPLADRLER